MIKEHKTEQRLEFQLEKKGDNIDFFHMEKKSLFTFSSTEKKVTPDQKSGRNRAINEVLRLLPPELCPRPTKEHAPAKPLSGIEHLMESHATPLVVLPQSKLVENTARFLKSKIDMEKCGRDWICSKNLVSSLTQTKFYKSQSQYFLTDDIPPLEWEASLLDLSSKGNCPFQ